MESTPLEVIHLRLINGEEIIGGLFDEDTRTVTVQDPLVVVNDSKGMIALTKYLPFAKDNICTLQRSHIIAYTELHPDIVKYYELSLKMSTRVEDSNLEDIRSANYMMEQALTYKPLYLEMSKLGHILPQSNTIN